MAGESPDRSKQHESSEEPTSGSAGPVPEARTEASETRDPRLAVAREDAKRSAGAGAGSRGGVDTATRVLSVRETETGASGGDAEAGTPGAADTTSDTPEKPEGPATGTDGRLRDAVAAWVATADERAAANARLDGTRDAEEPAPDGERADTAARAEDAGSDPQTTGAPEATDADTAPAEDSDDAENTTRDSDAESRSVSGSGSAPDTAADSGSASGSGADSAADTDAAPDSDEAPGSDSGAGSASNADETSGTSAVSGPDAGSDPASGSGASSDKGSGAGSASDADTGSGEEAGVDTASGADAAPEAASHPDEGSDTTSGSPADANADTGRGATSAADPDEGSGLDPATGPKPNSGAGSKPGSDADAGREAGGDGDGGPEPAVDQPTAVFKAPRLDGPAVDQPTTMLKLGDAAAASKKAEKTGKAEQTGKAGTAEQGSDAERTSKFVALRNPDDPATRKPPRTRETSGATEAPEAPSAPGTPGAPGAPGSPGSPGAPDAPGAPKAPQGQAPRPEAPKAGQAAPRTGVTAARSHVGPDRTTQQPLPPKPPLDLLAELTNTPPPPETPLRTTVRRVKIWTPLVVLLLIVFGVVQSMRPLPAPTLDLTAQDSFTFDGGKPEIPWPSSGQAALDVQGIGTFGSSGDQKPVPIASVAKVMTAYVILRDHPLKSGAEGPKIKIDQAAEDQSQAGQESTVNVFEGDSISQREALESILIASANNVARLLARWDAGSEKAFVEKMNAAAKDLGMTNTTYTDPSGLNNTTVSTAVDQVKLAKEAMKEPAFREVAAMMSYDDYKGVNHSNWNHLVGHNNVVGIKTGTTTSALGNLVFAAKKEVGGETKTIVGAVVRQPAGGADNTILGAALDSSDKLIRAAQDTLKSSTILKKGTVVGYVDDGLGGRTPVVATKDVKAVGWGGLTVKLTFDADEVPHTAQAGTKVGTLTVGDGGTSGAVKVPVALRDDLVEPGLSDKLTRLG